MQLGGCRQIWYNPNKKNSTLKSKSVVGKYFSYYRNLSFKNCGGSNLEERYKEGLSLLSNLKVLRSLACIKVQTNVNRGLQQRK